MIKSSIDHLLCMVRLWDTRSDWVIYNEVNVLNMHIKKFTYNFWFIFTYCMHDKNFVPEMISSCVASLLYNLFICKISVHLCVCNAWVSFLLVKIFSILWYLTMLKEKWHPKNIFILLFYSSNSKFVLHEKDSKKWLTIRQGDLQISFFTVKRN